MSSRDRNAGRQSWIAATLVLTTAGCSSLSDGARLQFSRALSCPSDHIFVAQARGRAFDPHPPASDIRGDAQRFAEWQRRNASLASRMAERTYYIARGCERQITYYCVHDDDGPLCTKTVPEFPDWDLVDLTSIGVDAPQ